MALAEEIDAAGIVPFANSNAEWRPANEWFVGEFLNHSAGGPQKVYDALTGRRTGPIPISWPQSKRSIRCSRTGGSPADWTATTPDRWPRSGSMFGAGEAAMKIEGTWFLPNVDEFFGETAGNENEWGWVPFPSVTGDAIFDLGIGQTYSINANSEHPEETAAFLDYYFSPETQARLLVKCGLVPARSISKARI